MYDVTCHVFMISGETFDIGLFVLEIRLCYLY